MNVLLKYDWFAPSEETVMELGNKNPRKVSGTFYKAGLHELPDSLKGRLPKTAKIVTDVVPQAAPLPNATNTLRDFDELRANSDAYVAIANKQGKNK